MRVTVLGGAAWNLMVHVDRLPGSDPATVHPRWHHEAIGGAAAGKAMNLARLGIEVTLFAGIGDDVAGARVRDGLGRAAVDVRATVDPGGTAQHVNVMDASGGRVSYMLANGSADLVVDERAIADSMAGADVVVVDLAPWTPRVLDLARDSGRPMWTDLHDTDGTSGWQDPFIDVAESVFMSGDRLDEPVAYLRSLRERGKRLTLCTLGRDGAIALDADGRRYDVPAVPDVEVVDTNGAGDAFFAGVLYGTLEGMPVERSLRYGSVVAALAVASPELASADLTADLLRREGS